MLVVRWLEHFAESEFKSKRPKSGCAIASHLPAVPDGLAFKNILMGPMAIHSVSPSNSGENDSKFRNA
ncbi:hypothetical protein T11_13423 [Trichinella zimbabwensis]|uniref:Uncharacterized protein n=1 Tax=Trichinella zimbabwensis TaxID=268475 RepID=A0A0V1HDE9_9BILA|nr:hypothetical protein T11_13423 [Trichinella zimbabwensis]